MKKQNTDKIRLKAFKEAAKMFGGVIKYAKALKTNRLRVSNWVHMKGISVPYEFCILTAHLTGISINRLSPTTLQVNRILQKNPHAGSNFDDWLKEEDIYVRVTKGALNKIAELCKEAKVNEDIGKAHPKSVRRLSKATA